MAGNSATTEGEPSPKKQKTTHNTPSKDAAEEEPSVGPFISTTTETSMPVQAPTATPTTTQASTPTSATRASPTDEDFALKKLAIENNLKGVLLYLATAPNNNLQCLAGYVKLRDSTSIRAMFNDTRLSEDILMPWLEFRQANYGQGDISRARVDSGPLFDSLEIVTKDQLAIQPPYTTEKLGSGSMVAEKLSWAITMHNLIIAKPHMFDDETGRPSGTHSVENWHRAYQFLRGYARWMRQEEVLSKKGKGTKRRKPQNIAAVTPKFLTEEDLKAIKGADHGSQDGFVGLGDSSP